MDPGRGAEKACRNHDATSKKLRLGKLRRRAHPNWSSPERMADGAGARMRAGCLCSANMAPGAFQWRTTPSL